VEWDPLFDRQRGEFAPLQGALEPFRNHRDWPSLDDWNAAFPNVVSKGGARIRFVAQPPKRRQRNLEDLYDERIFVRGEVPSRERGWHDFFNMLVWATFPAIKVAINARQRAALRARVTPDMTKLPGARTREQDALAMLDEGGVMLVDGRQVILGHAIYEHLVLHTSKVHAYVVDGATLLHLLESGAPLPEDTPLLTL
jgi:hypothetical protein